MNPPGGHIPVLLAEVIAALAPRDGALYLDGTFGGGGYSEALLRRAQCRVVALDRDPDAIRRGDALKQLYADLPLPYFQTQSIHLGHQQVQLLTNRRRWRPRLG